MRRKESDCATTTVTPHSRLVAAVIQLNRTTRPISQLAAALARPVAEHLRQNPCGTADYDAACASRSAAERSRHFVLILFVPLAEPGEQAANGAYDGGTTPYQARPSDDD